MDGWMEGGRERKDLEKGDNRVKITLVFIKRHMLEGRASIRKTSVISTKEYCHGLYCFITSFNLWKYPFQNLQSPPCVIPTIPS